MKGAIYAMWHVRCGRCQKTASLDTPFRFAANERRSELGWKVRRAYGYICPECSRAIADAGMRRIEAKAARKVSK